MKTQVKNLKPGDVFDVTISVEVRFTGRGDNHSKTYTGDQVSPLRLEEFDGDKHFAKCKIKNVPSDLWVFVPLDAKCEVKG